MTDEQKKIYSRRITEAGPTEMVVVLYDMTLTYMDEAQAAHEAQDVNAYRLAISRTRNCIAELVQSLNLQYEPAPALLQLYRFCTRRLIAAEIQTDDDPLKEVRRVIEPLREAYAKLAAEHPGEAVMGNSQSVYAGLTYGKGALNENTTGGSNRGFLA